MIPDDQSKGTIEKALQINLDPRIYGTIAEIGAGQEVARNFFIAGGASGTIAKTMSAYDMQFSDAIYGKEKDNRYVSQSRVNKMLDREYGLVLERLENNRPENTMFFAFADTVAAKGFKTGRDCHGWMGIKFQTSPMEEANRIVLHVRMKDSTNLQQQECLGRLGINLIYAAFYHSNEPEKVIESLLDNLSRDRLEIDMIKFKGPKFNRVDNRLLALHLVRSGITRSIFFTKEGEPVQGSDLLYKKNILFLRGSYRPFTKVHLDILTHAKESFLSKNGFPEQEVVVLTEISMSHLLAFGDLDKSDFLGRVDTLCTMGYDVQISDYSSFHKLKKHLSQYTKNKISVALGVKNVSEIFSHKFYDDLKGGIVEGLGMLFSEGTNLFVYPKLLKDESIRTVDEMTFDDDIKYLFYHFYHTGRILPISNNDPELISIFTKDIRAAMAEGNDEWRNKIPDKVYEIIKQQKLFGYKLNKPL